VSAGITVNQRLEGFVHRLQPLLGLGCRQLPEQMKMTGARLDDAGGRERETVRKPLVAIYVRNPTWNDFGG